MQRTPVTNRLGTIRRLIASMRSLPGAPAEARRLRDDNKRLSAELRRRPRTLENSSGGSADEERRSVDSFHVLYRERKRIDKDTFWRGHRVIKCPLDLWMYQELIHELQPGLIVETGTMYGGSAYYLASIMDLVGTGEVVTIDHAHREGRPRHPRITYLTGSSTDRAVVEAAASRAAGVQTVMVILDSNHDAPHVLDEMRAYHPLVTPGSYMVVEDTNINGHPVEPAFGPGPMEAVRDFLRDNDEFAIDRAREKFLLTFNPDGWLRKRS